MAVTGCPSLGEDVLAGCSSELERNFPTAEPQNHSDSPVSIPTL